jgi:predicted ATPase
VSELHGLLPKVKVGERYPNAKILYLDESGISEVSYEETEHFSITKSFLNNYKKLLVTLLADD